MSDPFLDKTVDFTSGTAPRGGEVRVIEVWFIIALHALGLLELKRAQGVVRAITANPRGSLAGRSLDSGFMAEHYRSLLDPVLTNPDQIATLDQFRSDFEGVVGEFLALKRPQEDMKPQPEDRDIR